MATSTESFLDTGRGMLAGRFNNNPEVLKTVLSLLLKVAPPPITCDVEKDLDFLVSGWSPDSPLPLCHRVRPHGGVPLLPGERARACNEAGLEISVILGTLSAPAVAPTSWCW